ncbi:MAG: glycosyltransferase family 2 protein [Candidatus Eutrophobiaceae bacterium]
MYHEKRVSVVVPAYNEESLLPRVLESMPDYVDDIVVIDDCSTDNTADVVKNHPLFSTSRVVLLRHEANRGVGAAIATGYKWARDHGSDIAVVMAGDAQMDPADMPSLLDIIIQNKADYAKGNRLVTDEAFQIIPKIRFFGNAALSLLTKIASGYWHVADSQTGYTAANMRVLQGIDWDRMHARYGQPNDLLVRLNIASFRVMDVSVKPIYGVGEKSGIDVKKVVFSIGFLLLKLFLLRVKEKYLIRNFHPLLFFYLFGFLCLFISFLFFARLLVLWFANGAMPEITTLFWFCSFSVGFNSLFFAMWFDYEENKHLNPPIDLN